MEASPTVENEKIDASKKSTKTPIQEATDYLRLIVAPDQIVELRALKVKSRYGRPHAAAGWFDYAHIPDMAKAAVAVTNDAAAVYFTINPVNPDLIARRCNRLDVAEEGELTKDVNIIHRRWLMIDIDPTRDALVSATDAEKEKALGVIAGIRAFLDEQKWPAPVFSDSGNGYHLLYRIDMPANDDNLVKRVLLALAQKFNSEFVKVDTSVFNPSRICKLAGTMARKGDHVPEYGRIHRRAYLIEAPEIPTVVRRELLESLAAEFSEPQKTPTARPQQYAGGASRLLVDRWLTDRGRAYRTKNEKDSLGRTVYVLKECPFDPSHADPDSCVMQDSSGKLSAKCLHNSCSGRGWQQFKEAIGPPDRDHYDPPYPESENLQPSFDDVLAEFSEGKKYPSLRSVVKRLLPTIKDLHDNKLLRVHLDLVLSLAKEKYDPPIPESEAREIFVGELKKEKELRTTNDVDLLTEKVAQEIDALVEKKPREEKGRNGTHQCNETQTNGDQKDEIDQWHLVIIESDPKQYLLRSRFWNDNPRLENGYLKLTDAELSNWENKSPNSIYKAALRQADITVPTKLKGWSNHGGMLGKLLKIAEHRQAPPEMKQSLAILGVVFQYLATARPPKRDDSGKIKYGDGKSHPLLLEDGSIIFKLAALKLAVSFNKEQFKHSEMIHAMNESGFTQKLIEERRWWVVKSDIITKLKENTHE